MEKSTEELIKELLERIEQLEAKVQQLQQQLPTPSGRLGA
jgi:phage shock protein A